MQTTRIVALKREIIQRRMLLHGIRKSRKDKRQIRNKGEVLDIMQVNKATEI